MSVLVLFLAFWLGSSVSACDESEIANIKIWNGYSVFFIYAAEGISNGSFELETFFHLVEFNDTSHSLPLIVDSQNNFIHTGKKYSCEEEDFLGFSTLMLLAPSYLNMSGILYGCDIVYKVATRFIIYDNASWNEEDQKNYCERFQGVPFKLLRKMNSCFLDFKSYSHKCIRDKEGKTFEGIKVISGILLSVAILFFGYTTFKHFKIN